MSLDRPFYRNYRPMVDGQNSGYSDWAYIVDKEYAQAPEHFTRAFLMIQSDLRKLFEYVEPCDKCLETHSFRIYELFIRTCIELEANFKAILKENIYTPTKTDGSQRDEKDWKIYDYQKVNTTHHLDDYEVIVPIWSGVHNAYKPFSEWKIGNNIPWYQAYNNCKHDRMQNFQEANLNNLIQSVTGLFVLISSQFRTESFSPGQTSLSVGIDSYYEGNFGLGDFFIVKFPTNWTDDEKYGFDWSILKTQQGRFKKIDYNSI